MWNQRPKPEDSEKDLLEFQKQFLASGSAPCAKVVKSSNCKEKAAKGLSVNFDPALDLNNDCGSANGMKTELPSNDCDKNDENMDAEMKKYDTHITTILSNTVMEKNVNMKPKFPAMKYVANPQASEFSQKHRYVKRNKRSLFAQQFEKNCANLNQSEPANEISVQDQTNMQQLRKSDLLLMHPFSRVVTGEGLKSFGNNSGSVVDQIHEENIAKLSQMNSDDVAQEQKKLKENLDEKILAFLRKRSKKEPELDANSAQKETVKYKSSNAETPALQVNEKWLHMNKVEKEKMQWMENESAKTDKKIDLPSRFDFAGSLLSLEESERLPSHVGLHHHGSQPDLAGYTLQELLSLSRSQFSQQQVFAFRTLAKIIVKDKQGKHFPILSQFATPLLLEAGFAFVLRWGLDQRSDNCIQAVIEALHALVHPGKQQELFLDSYFLNMRGCEFPSFKPHNISDEPPSKNETDFELSNRDLIKGLAQMDLCWRIRYVLEVCQLDQSVVNNCLEVLQQYCLHSTELAVRVLDCPRLITYVIENYLPLMWPSDCPENESQNVSWPNANAVRLIRMMCQAGRHLTSRIIHNHSHLKTFLVKVFASVENIPKKEIQGVEIETWMLWTVCLSYGFYLDLYSELFSTLLMKLRFCTELLNGDEFYVTRVQYLLKAMSAVVTNLPTENSRKDLCVSWDEVKEIYCLSQTIVSTILSSDRKESLNEVVPVGLNILTTCIEKASHCCEDLETSVYPCIVALLTEDVIKSHAVLKFATKFSTQTIVQSLLDLKLSLFSSDEISGFLLKTRKANFVSSYLRCSVALCRSNRSFCEKFVPFLSEWYRVDKNEIVHQDLSGFSNRVTLHCLYWLVKLFVICVVEIPSLKTFSKYYHLLSLSCLGSLSQGDEEFINDLLSNAIFSVDFFNDQMDNRFSAVNALPSMRTIYMFLTHCSSQSQMNASKQWSFQISQNISSFLISPDGGPLLPADWPYLPIVHFYDKAIHQGEPADLSSTNVILNTVRSCLIFLLFLEQYRSEMWKKVNVTAKITRLMCLYMTGSDIFRHELIASLMKQLFNLYTKPALRSSIDFNLPISGVVSFYDFYVSLLDQYDGVSFGDQLFSAVILVPIISNSKSNFKLALWAEHTEALRSISLTEDQLLLSKEAYLSPPEDNFQVIRSYLRAIVSGHCHPRRCPFLYQLATHHVKHFISNPSHMENHREISSIASRLSDEALRNQLLS